MARARHHEEIPAGGARQFGRRPEARRQGLVEIRDIAEISLVAPGGGEWLAAVPVVPKVL